MSKFGDAFAAARKSGKKEFTFGGERYNTRMRDEENAKPTAKAIAATSGKTQEDYIRSTKDKAAIDAFLNKPAAKATEKPAAKPAAATSNRVGFHNAADKAAKISGAASRYSDSAKQGDAAAKKSIAAGQADRMKDVMRDAAADKKAIAAGQAARMAERAANIAKSKKDYDPSSAGSNFKMALAKMGFKKGGSANLRAERTNMPSKTPKQKSFMAAVANNPKFAKKVGVPSKVGKEFAMKDKKMAAGGLAAGHKTADGVAKKGKTDTKMPKMAMGGKMKGC
jgi:hypothetical protein